VDGGIGVLDEAGKQADEHGAGLGFGEFFRDDGDGGGGGDFSQIEAANAIGHHEEVPVERACWREAGMKHPIASSLLVRTFPKSLA